jgi:co-chaperonin GroES (HSP10)
MRAINKYLIIRRSKDTAKTNGGLLLSASEEAQFRYQIGEVVNTGTLVDYIKEGDKVYFDKVPAFDISLDGEMLTVIQERDVVVVL